MSSFFLRSAAAFALASPMALAVPAAFADDTPSPEDETRVFERVVVTAQKREESLQDVPIVVTAVDSELISDAGVRDIKDLTILTPGLLVTSSTNETVTTARIRGVGTVGDNPGLESSVGVVVDGVFRARNGVGFGDLGELERIEVLKGPQGTLFGKSTSAGVINIITRAPTFDAGAGAAISYGNYDLMRVEGYVNGPLGDKVAGRLYGAVNERGGYFDVVTGIGPRTETEDNTSNYYTLRGQLLFEPTEDISLRIIADLSDRDELCCLGSVVAVSDRSDIIRALTGGEGFPAEPSPGKRVAYANRTASQQIDDKGVSAQLDWDLGFADLTVISAVREWRLDYSQDGDFNGADLWIRPLDKNRISFDATSLEARLAGETDRLDWLVGAFYATEDLYRSDNMRLGSQYADYYGTYLLGGLPSVIGLMPPDYLNESDGADDTHEQDGTSLALFTNNTWAVTDAVDLTLGLRWTRDEKSLTSSYDTVGGTCAAVNARAGDLMTFLVTTGGMSPDEAMSTTRTVVGNLCLPWVNELYNGIVNEQDFSDEQLSGTAKLAWRLNSSVMTYLSYSRGYKAGGFNVDRVSSATGQADFSSGFIPVMDTSFPAETVDSYELGWKVNSASGRLTLNGAYFYQEYSDFQLNTFLGTGFVVASIPDVTSSGVDLDVAWAPSEIEGLSVQSGVTFAETQYGDFTPINPGLYRLPGTRLSFAPRWSLTGAVTYEHALNADWTARWNLSARYTTDYNTGSDLDPLKTQEDYALVNGRLVVEQSEGPFSVELWAQNLFDEDYRQVAFNVPLVSGALSTFMGAPRTFGATLRVDF